MRTDEQVALVTGGTRGVGRGIARELAANGARVFVTGRSAVTDLEPGVTGGWEQPLWRWDAMFDAGVRAHYHASQRVAPSMITRGKGLIVNISFWAAQKRIGNVAYGVSKAATDKMTHDMAEELRPHGVCVVSLYPGLVRTEKVMEAAAWLDLSNSESPEFIGRAVNALGADPDVMRHSGKVLVAAAIANEYGFSDINDVQPRPLALADI